MKFQKWLSRIKNSVTIFLIVYALMVTIKIRSLEIKCDGFGQVAESAMISQLAIFEIANRNKEFNSAQRARNWISLIYKKRSNLGLEGDMWDNYFNDAESRGLLKDENSQ